VLVREATSASESIPRNQRLYVAYYARTHTAEASSVDGCLCLYVCLSRRLPDPKSRTEGRGKLKIGTKEAVTHLEVERSEVNAVSQVKTDSVSKR